MGDRLPLYDVHERLGARFAAAGLLVPASYADAGAEHEAVRERAGLIDRSERGKIEVTGKDRATFLHGLVSNDVKGLTPGHGAETALLDSFGKVTALFVVHCLEDRLVLETDRALAEPLQAAIDRYLFSERVELEDVSDASGILTVAGPLARKVVETALGHGLPDLRRWQHLTTSGKGPRPGSCGPRRRGRRVTTSGCRQPGLPRSGTGSGTPALSRSGETPGTFSGWRQGSFATGSTWMPRRCSWRRRSPRPTP